MNKSKISYFFFITLLSFSLISCLNSCKSKPLVQNKATENIETKKLEKHYLPKIVQIYPHSTSSYTQGLYYFQGFLYEGTGQYGASKLMKIDINSGNYLRKIDLLPIYFGEGITILNNKIYQLTWQNKKGFIYDLNSFKKIGEFSYPGEGWGITSDSTNLIISDGSNFLNFYNPESFELIKTLMVARSDDSPVYNLNELEYINGKIFANIYMTNDIAIINPETGKVEGILDITSLKLQLDSPEEAEVANGIAYNPEKGHYFITGKYWSNLFEIELTEE